MSNSNIEHKYKNEKPKKNKKQNQQKPCIVKRTFFKTNME
ncbi:hypothetical protein DOY81_007119 [Sarcophaga bullata]|nr:hypothetical protein DOY81_007119 [Sarcophaga bullata]